MGKFTNNLAGVLAEFGELQHEAETPNIVLGSIIRMVKDVLPDHLKERVADLPMKEQFQFNLLAMDVLLRYAQEGVEEIFGEFERGELSGLTD